ncbi:hypothetical protein K439DRAFT_1264950, partial [Ramaria rubella]
TSNVKLELPPELTAQIILPKFHASQIRPHIPNDEEQFPCCNVNYIYDFGKENEPEWFVDEIIAHRWASDSKLELQVQWAPGDVTWGPLSACRELEALDAYLELRGVRKPHELP